MNEIQIFIQVSLLFSCVKEHYLFSFQASGLFPSAFSYVFPFLGTSSSHDSAAGNLQPKNKPLRSWRHFNWANEEGLHLGAEKTKKDEEPSEG